MGVTRRNCPYLQKTPYGQKPAQRALRGTVQCRFGQGLVNFPYSKSGFALARVRLLRRKLPLGTQAASKVGHAYRGAVRSSFPSGQPRTKCPNMLNARKTASRDKATMVEIEPFPRMKPGFSLRRCCVHPSSDVLRFRATPVFELSWQCLPHYRCLYEIPVLGSRQIAAYSPRNGSTQAGIGFDV